jgi:hypothetical protein
MCSAADRASATRAWLACKVARAKTKRILKIHGDWKLQDKIRALETMHHDIKYDKVGTAMHGHD